MDARLCELVAGLSGEVGGEGETVGAHDGVAPFDGAAPRVAESVDGEGRSVRWAVQLDLLGRGGDDGVDVFVAVVEANAGAGSEFGVEAGVCEVSL